MSEKKSSKKNSVKKQDAKKQEKKEEVREEIIEDMNEKLEKEEEKEEKEKPNKKQLQSERKILFIFGVVLLLLLASFIGYLIFSNNVKSFTSKGITYDMQKEGTLTLYHARIPIIYNGSYYHFNVFFRNDPRKLESEVPFNGSIIFMRNMAINYNSDIICGGDGTVAIANWLNVYKYLGVNVVRDPNATCDPLHRYVYVNISVSNETSIEETALGCYQINVNHCDILPATERFLTDSIAYYENVTQLS